MSESNIYVVTYRNPEKTDENIVTRVRNIQDSNLGPTFITLSDFVFGSTSKLLNPQDEYTKKRFQKTKKLHLSIYHIISIEEIGEGKALGLAPKDADILIFDPQKPHKF